MSELIEQYLRLLIHSEAQKYSIAKLEGTEVKYPHKGIYDDDGKLIEYIYLTESDLVASIEGKKSLGLILCKDKEGISKSGCIDIDIPRDAKTLTEALSIAQNIVKKGSELGVNLYIEYSGNRGFHVWLFVEKAITPKLIKQCLESIALRANFTPQEIYPKDVNSNIKLPCTIHLKTNKRCGFISPNFDVNNPEIDLSSQGDLMAKFEVTALDKLINLSDLSDITAKSDNKNNSDTLNEPRSKEDIEAKLKSLGDHPSCIKHLMSNGAPLGVDYNQVNLTLIRYCLTRGFNLNEALKLAELMAKNTTENHSTSKDYQGKLKNFKSAWVSCERNSDNYKFECSYILSGIKEGEASKRGCIGTKCLIHKNHKPNYQSSNSENRADTPNNVNNENKPKIRLVNALIFDSMVNLSNEGKELVKSQILRVSETLEENYLFDNLSDKISDSIRLIESEVIAYLLQNPEAIIDYSDIFSQGFIATIKKNDSLSEYLDNLYNYQLPSQETIEEYLELIREKGINLVASDNFKNYQESLSKADNLEVLSKSIDDTENLLNKSLNDKQILPLTEHLADLYESLFTEDVVSISTPSKHLNNVLNGGFMKGKLYVIGAPPANGKSTICAWCGDYASMKGFKIVYGSYEMSREQLFTASLSRISGVNSALIERRKWLDESYPQKDKLEAQIEQGITDIADNISDKLTILECDESYTPNRLKTICKKLKTDLLIVDYLQLLSSGDEKLDSSYQETLRVSKIATELKRLARYLNIPVIAISDINKDAYLKAISGGDLDMGALRDSFKIAHSADVILLLQSGIITIGKGNEKQQVNQLDLLEKKYPEKGTELDKLKAKYPLNNKTADTYARLSIVKNRGGKLGEPIFRYSRALHNFEPMDFDIEFTQDEIEF